MFDSDDDHRRDKGKGKKDFDKKDNSFQNRSNGNNNNDDGASFNGDGGSRGGGSNDGNDDKKNSDAVDSSDESEILTIDELIFKAKMQKVVSIAEKSGAGCTTVLETIGEKIINEWVSNPILFLINMNTSWCLENDVFHNIENCSDQEILEKTIEILKNFTYFSKLEEVKYRKHFQTGGIVFLWDGIDRIPSRHFEDFLAFLKRVKKSQNIQFVTANRFISKIEHILEVKSYRMVPLSDDDIKLFVEKYTSELNIKPVERKQFLESTQVFESFLKSPQIMEAYVEVSRKDSDVSNMFNVAKKIVTSLSMSKKKYDCDIFESDIDLPVHHAVSIKTVVGESFDDVTNDGKTVKFQEMRISKCIPIKRGGFYENFKFYNFFYKDDDQFYFHQKFIALFFVAHYILTSILFLSPDYKPSDINIRYKFLFFIANHNDENINFIKTLVIHGINVTKDEQKVPNPYISEIIRNNFPYVFNHLKFNPSAIEFLTDCFMHDREILNYLWNNGKRCGIVYKVIQSGLNEKEFFSMARKYFDEKEIITFKPKFKYGFKAIFTNEYEFSKIELHKKGILFSYK